MNPSLPRVASTVFFVGSLVLAACSEDPATPHSASGGAGEGGGGATASASGSGGDAAAGGTAHAGGNGGSTTSAGGAGGDGGAGPPACADFCVQEQACSDFPLQDCQDQCAWTYDIYVDTSPACQAAVDDAFKCMAAQPCDGWSDASLPSGACAAAIAAENAACTGAGFFAGWDACVATCRRAVDECHVDIPNVSTWTSYEQCWGECKFNKLTDADAGCVVEGLAYDKCEIALECSTLQQYLGGDASAAPDCAALSQAWANACAF